MFKYILLGIVQGVTEFLPVSSSGHLVLFQKLLNIESMRLAIIAVSHLGTLFALLIFFFNDILLTLKNRRLLRFILIVTVVTGIVGIIGKDFFESLFTSVKVVGTSLLLTGILLLLTKKFSNCIRDKGSVGISDATLLGLAQSLSIIPGVSRSGATISLLLFRGFKRELAFKLSFLASIPAIIGAFILETKEIALGVSVEFVGLLFCFIFAFLSGLLSLWVLRYILRKAKLHFFGYYCILVGLFVLFYFK